MAKIFFCVFLAVMALPCMGVAKDNSRFGAMLTQVDDAVEHFDVYVSRREARIAALQEALRSNSNPHSAYDLSYQLYEEYRPFVNDSAIYYLNLCIGYAKKFNDNAKVNLCLTCMASRCSNTGMYEEARRILSQINPNEMNKGDVGKYYYANMNLYGELKAYTHFPNMREEFYNQEKHFRELAIATLPKYDNNRMLLLEQKAMEQNDLKASKRVNDVWLSHVKKGSYPYAMVTLYRYIEYKNVGDTIQMMHNIIESVLCDLHNGVMDQGSMWELANQLMYAGDIDRAYKYISFTSDCAGRFGSRQRQSQINPLLAAIAKMYKEQSQRNFTRMLLALGIMGLFVIIALSLYFYANSQRNRLAEARAKLRDSNEMLQNLNGELKALNNQLKDSNRKLTEANRVKDEYLGRFLSMCSIYVDRLDSLRKRVSKLVKKHDFDGLLEITRNADFKEKELEELYGNFDSAFLNLFPNFVTQFNALLRPDSQIPQPDDGRLNTTLRIFALIRLGIEDSSKIADFLHYSVNTIYNYRAQVKNGALVDRKDFEAKVKAIS